MYRCRKHRGGAIAALTALVLGLTPLNSASTHSAAAAPADTPIKYVALGDSYASLGALPIGTPFTPLPELPDSQRNMNVMTPLGELFCRFTQNVNGNYPSFVAAELGAYLTDATCGSADTDHYFEAQFPGLTPPQQDALTPDTDLVTVTFGGNDARVAWLFYGCIAGAAFSKPLQSSCAAWLREPQAQRFAEVPQKLDKVVQDIRRRAPHATIILTGYLNALDPGTNCSALRMLWPKDRQYAVEFQARLNQEIRAAAARNNVIAVGTDQLVGHDVCQPPEQRWVNAAGVDTVSFPMHPTVAGQKHMAELVVKAYRQTHTSR